jgi:anti-sigma regulatory factor (Ser/Thr protein kinase)
MLKTVKMKINSDEIKRKIKTAVIKVDASENNLGAIRNFINSMMENSGFSKKKISALVVSVTEHCENLIRHAYDRKGGEIVLKLELKYASAKITVLDWGPKFNMKKEQIPDISLRLKNGLGGKMGIKTILALCDRVEYVRKDGYNENRFIIRDKPAAGKTE